MWKILWHSNRASMKITEKLCQTSIFIRQTEYDVTGTKSHHAYSVSMSSEDPILFKSEKQVRFDKYWAEIKMKACNEKRKRMEEKEYFREITLVSISNISQHYKNIRTIW